MNVVFSQDHNLIGLYITTSASFLPLPSQPGAASSAQKHYLVSAGRTLRRALMTQTSLRAYAESSSCRRSSLASLRSSAGPCDSARLPSCAWQPVISPSPCSRYGPYIIEALQKFFVHLADPIHMGF